MGLRGNNRSAMIGWWHRLDEPNGFMEYFPLG